MMRMPLFLYSRYNCTRSVPLWIPLSRPSVQKIATPGQRQALPKSKAAATTARSAR